MQKYKSLSD